MWDSMKDSLPNKRLAGSRRIFAMIAAGLMLSLAAGCAKNKPYQSPQGPGRIDSGGLEQKSASTAPSGERRGFTRGASTDIRTGRSQINGFMWRAALDTVSFMPLNSADPYGGVIITDWYSPPETPGERFKVTVLVRGLDLQSDGVKVTVFRQARKAEGAWLDSKVDTNTQTDMENIILSQARVLRRAARNAPR